MYEMKSEEPRPTSGLVCWPAVLMTVHQWRIEKVVMWDDCSRGWRGNIILPGKQDASLPLSASAEIYVEFEGSLKSACQFTQNNSSQQLYFKMRWVIYITLTGVTATHVYFILYKSKCEMTRRALRVKILSWWWTWHWVQNETEWEDIYKPGDVP